MSFLRAGATAVLALLVSSASLASAQLTLCTPLVGDANLYDYPEALAVGPDGIIQAVGYYTSPDVIDSGITQFIFQYVVPDQTDYQTPNRLKFAMYTNVVYPDPNGLLPQLVAESQVVTIQSGVTGNQEFVAKVARKVSDIQPSTDYVLGQTPLIHHIRTHDSYHNTHTIHTCMSAGIVECSGVWWRGVLTCVDVCCVCECV